MASSSNAALWLLAFVSISVTGCSSNDSEDTNCGNVAACGGDLIGAWKVVDSCPAPGSRGINNGVCTEQLRINSIKGDGTLSLSADGTFRGSANLFISETSEIPLSCLTSNAPPMTCDEHSAISGSSCTMDADTCDCTVTTGTGWYDFGGETYVISGNTLALANNELTTYDYCVQGSMAHLIVGSKKSVVSYQGDIVLAKQ